MGFYINRSNLLFRGGGAKRLLFSFQTLFGIGVNKLKAIQSKHTRAEQRGREEKCLCSNILNRGLGI